MATQYPHPAHYNAAQRLLHTQVMMGHQPFSSLDIAFAEPAQLKVAKQDSTVPPPPPQRATPQPLLVRICSRPRTH
jgi:hypothetical protein